MRISKPSTLEKLDRQGLFDISWYINEKKWNSMAYPWSQAHFWWRSLYPTLSDWNLKVSIWPRWITHARLLTVSADSEVSQTQWILGTNISPPFAWLCSAGCSRISDPKDEEVFMAVINGCLSELCLKKPRSCFKVTVVNVARLLQENSGSGIIHLSGA